MKIVISPRLGRIFSAIYCFILWMVLGFPFYTLAYAYWKGEPITYVKNTYRTTYNCTQEDNTDG